MLPLLKFKNQLFYGWIVVISLLVVSTVFYGTSTSFGLFFKSIESEFSLTRTMTSAISSANLVLAGFIALGSGWALDRYGPKKIIFFMGLFTGLSLLLTSQTNAPWQLFITYSLLLSMGIGAVYVVPTSTISRWFDKKRGLALGITGAGSGLGMIVMAPLATYLILNFDWRTAYIVIGLIAWAIIIPLSRLLKRDPSEVGALVDGKKYDSIDNQSSEGNIQPVALSFRQVLSTRNFWFLTVTWLFFGHCLFLVFTHLVPHILDTGFSPGEAAGVVSLIGGAAIAGRVLGGIASDRIGRKLAAIISALLQAGAMLWVIWSHELWMFYVFALVYGFASNSLGCAMGALIGDVFGLSRIGTTFGALEVSFGIGAATGSIVGGLVFDISGSYFTAFLIATLSMFLAALLISLVKRKRGTEITATYEQ